MDLPVPGDRPVTGQVIYVLLSERHDLAAARRFFTPARPAGTVPAEVTTDRAPVYPRIHDEQAPLAPAHGGAVRDNPIEADHGRLAKARLRPMRGLKRRRSARILAAGHAFMQNLRRGHYDIATDVPVHHKLPTIFDELGAGDLRLHSKLLLQCCADIAQCNSAGQAASVVVTVRVWSPKLAMRSSRPPSALM